MTPLPRIMVAPNGAYKTKADHPNLPVTIAETVDAVTHAHHAGANGAHVHLRDTEQRHLLDVAMYRDLIAALKAACPGLYIQITTEAAGRYSSKFQRDLILELAHPYVSAAIVELVRDCTLDDLRKFYANCADLGVVIQHIFYDVDDMKMFQKLLGNGVTPAEQNTYLFVLGRYRQGQQSTPADLDPFLACLRTMSDQKTPDWAVCAFGAQETQCLVYAIANGGKARIGFENNLLNETGKIARSNAERVAELNDYLL